MKTIKHKHNHSPKNSLNHVIIHILTLVKNYYKDQNDKIRVKTYDSAIYQIRKWDKIITKGNELSHLEGIGKGMIEKIDTIIRSGTLPIIKEKNISMDTNKKTKKINLVNNNNNSNSNNNKNNKNNNVDKILGFSIKSINEIKTKYNARTINDFRKVFSGNKSNGSSGDHDKLTHIQELGLKYYEDLNDLIPRHEITYIGNKIKSIVENMHGDDGAGSGSGSGSRLYTVMISGSYPSQSKEFSKDIDIIIVRNKNTLSHKGELKNIINYIKDGKGMDLEIISLGEKKFMGLLKTTRGNEFGNKIDNKMRHIDIRFVNMEELPYTWFYYSSGYVFNILIRKKLKQKGYKLNEYGLYKNNKKVALGDSLLDSLDYNLDYIDENKLLKYIENSEREIFKIADMDYKNVKERY